MKRFFLLIILLISFICFVGCSGNTDNKEINVSELQWNYTEAFVYDGTVKTVKLVSVPDYLSVVYSGNSATQVGTYIASVSFIASGGYKIVGTVPDLNWEIKEKSDNPVTNYLSIAEAIELANGAGESGTSEKQFVKGVVKNITNSIYGEMYITDGTNDLYIYGVYSSDGVFKYSELENKPYSGDEVFLYGILKTYNGQAEMGAAWLQDFVSHQGEIDLSEYTPKTIKEAREIEEGSKVIIEGVVSKITYANGMKPNGIYLVDNTGSIYVYGLELAGRVSMNERVKVAGTKTLYILDSEKNNAELFGYQGSIQLQDAVYISSSTEKVDFDKMWIKESTVKKMIETPMSENITTDIFKVNAIINKAPGHGFVNYYINDLDNETGSYCYSLCNGSDYSYLDAFDGKICTVYLSAINCKATSSGTIYRFVPILVLENTDFCLSDEEITLFALEYYAKTQFRPEYNSDPELELLTLIANEYIPFEGVKVEYESAKDSIISFDKNEDKVVMHIATGNETVKITMKASYKEASATLEYDIFVNNKVIPSTISIHEAIEKADDEEVTVKGIVMSGVVNQCAFYLNDGTGVIAVRVDSSTIKNINLGNEIVVTGTKSHFKKTDTLAGQACIDNATLEVNLLGNHEYSTETFITNLSYDDIMQLINSTDDLTTNVYVVECYLKKVESAYYSNFYLTNESKDKDIYLYAGSGNQYSIYNEFLDGRKLTVTFALCNWNSKTPYRACIISATDGETTILNNYNFR